MITTRTFAILAASVLAGPALAAPGDELCKRDLFMADAGISGSYRSLEMGGRSPRSSAPPGAATSRR